MHIDKVSRVLLHVQSNYDNLVFFSKHLFSLSNVHHSFSNLKRVFKLMIIKTKALEIGKFHFKTQLSILFQLTFKRVFDLENHGFKKCVFNKSYSFFCYLRRGVDALYINDIDQDIVKSNYIQDIIVNWV